MKIGMIDVDNWSKMDKCFPNLVLMKLSRWHKQHGDDVEWWDESKHYDLVYKSKVFSFTEDITDDRIDADEIRSGGTGYFIKLVNGREEFQPGHTSLPDEIEHIYPDYDLYGITDTAYGFLSRGCPRGCFFCHVKSKEGMCSHKVADLSEFWSGQKNIEVMDPNTLACSEWKDLLQQLIDSKARINFNQGVDVRLLTEEKCEMLMQMKINQVHFAWDRYQDKEYIVPKLQMVKRVTGWCRSKVTVYILTNFDTTMEQNLERIELCRSLDFNPYIMRYDKEHLKRGCELNALARYVNTKRIFWSCPSFEQYKREEKQGMWR